ncbi:hypothetical protein G4B88_002306 [Cannabis sativa]|uniref:Uncharacterized protein n=1 Tax=Cannabis sativa TaxID=3483 RepID=A0A7J6EUQ4_CANSA|nr:hypothetical protein G4B88_002306 [Cannabis sativa]
MAEQTPIRSGEQSAAIEARVSTSWQELQDILLSFDSKLDRLTTLSGATKNLNLSSPSANSHRSSSPSNSQQPEARATPSQVPGETTVTQSGSHDQNQVSQTRLPSDSTGSIDIIPASFQHGSGSHNLDRDISHVMIVRPFLDDSSVNALVSINIEQPAYCSLS